MPKGKEEMMDWLYQFVKSFREQGITIQDLSERIDENLSEEVAANQQVKDEIWHAFVRRYDVSVQGSEEEVGVMRTLELCDTLALGYGVRKVSVQAQSVDVEMIEAAVGRRSEKEPGKGATDGNGRTAQSEKPIDSFGSVIADVTTPIQRSPEPKEQFIPVGKGSSFTRAGPSPEPRSGNKKSYKIADDPRGSQGSQRRLQSLLNAARVEADNFHTPNLAPPSQRNNVAKDVEMTGVSPVESTHIPKSDHRSHTNQPTTMINPQDLRPGSSAQFTDTNVSANGQPPIEMNIEIPEHPAKVQLPVNVRSTPIVGYQYQSDLSKNTPGKDAQASISSLDNNADGIDYFAPDITRHGPVPGQQRKRGRPKGSGHGLSTSSQAVEASSPEYPANMSFSSLAELEQFQTPKPPPKKRGRPKGPTIKHKGPINETPPEVHSEETADAGLHITESGLRTSRRQPKPRQFFTPTQVSSPEPEPEPEPEPTTAKPGKSVVSTTPSKLRRHREPLYTSYEDLLREEDDKKRKAGIDGVYINPLDAKEGRTLARKKTLVVLVKSEKLRDSNLLVSRKGTWIEVLAERRKNLQAMVGEEAANVEAATAAAAAEDEKSKKRKRDEESEAKRSKRPKPLDLQPDKSLEVIDSEPKKASEVTRTESTKPSEVIRTEPAKPSEVTSAGTAELPEIPSTRTEKPSEVLNVGNTELSTVPNTEPAKQSEVPNIGTGKPPSSTSAETAILSEIPGPKPDSFPSNEELALEFERFKARSAEKLSVSGPNTELNSFPSNDELALEFERFRSGFAQQPSQGPTPELFGPSRSTLDPFVANPLQYGQQATSWSHPKAPASSSNTQSSESSSFLSPVYMDSMRPRSPQPQYSHPVSQYESPPHNRPHNISFQNEARSPDLQQPVVSRWTGPLEPHQLSATVRNRLPPASNINSHSSPYRVPSENGQSYGRRYQPPQHGNTPATHTPSPVDRYRSSYEGEQQATPSFLALNSWSAKSPAHLHNSIHQRPAQQSPAQQIPVQQSPPQNSWPAGFLPPEPPKPPQIRPKTGWPAGFLPPDALLSDTSPSSPMSTDSFQRFSPASSSHASEPSTVAHTSQEIVANRPTTYASPRSMSHPHIPQPLSIPSSPSPYSRPTSSMTDQQSKGYMGRQNLMGQVQISSPLSHQFNPMESALSTPHAPHVDSHTSPPRLEIDQQAQLSPQLSVQVLPTQGTLSTKSVEESQPGNLSHQVNPPKSVESQIDQTLSKKSKQTQAYISPSVQSAPAPELAPEPKKRKRSMPNIQQTPSPQNSTVVISKLPESSSVNITTERVPPTATPDDVEAFKKAEAVPFESVFSRMSSIYNSVMGNLILSCDKSELKFWSMAEGITDPIWTMQVSKVAENPIVSMPGSNPMELRLKEKEDDESIVVHRFLIARTKEAHKSANEMRANLVTARIFIQMANPQTIQAEDPEVIADKPWKCEKCGARFKNKEGIKYHLSKSQTTCNPDFDPKTAKPRQYGRSRKETPNMETVTKVKGKPAASSEKEGQPVPTDDSEPEGGDSDDSVFEWAAKVAASKKSPKKTRGDRGEPVIGRSGKVYKSLGGERPALLEIAETVKQTPSLTEELAKIPSLPQTPDQTLPQSVLPASKEKVVKDVIMCLTRANNNALPGERGLWFAFVACWLKYYPTSKVLPEHKLFTRALDELLEDGIISKITFDFAGARSRTITRSILFDVRAPAPSIAEIAKLKDDVKAKHPDFYIPLGFSPPSVILEILNAIGKPSPLAPEMSATQLNDILGSDEEAGKGESSDDEFRPETHALDAEDDLEDDPMDLDVDSDGAASDFSPFPDYTPQVLQRPSLHQQIPSNSNGNQMKPRMRRPSNPLSLKERERRKHTTALQEQTWTPQPTALQNSANGAWDVSSKPKRTYKLRERLPEPTTIMQDPSGSWSVRPFGHGVNPIFARPNKMVVGNPQGEHYLQQREDSHRPVIHPNKPIMRPSILSKQLLNKNLQGDLVSRPDGQIEISKATGLQKRHYTYRTRSQKDPEISRLTGVTKRGYRSLTPDPMDLMEASIDGMTELDILNHYEAKPLEEEIGRQNNPGLASIPSPPLTPGLPHIFFNESAGLWDLAHPFVTCTNVEKLKMQWLDRTSFTLETLPYSALEDNDDLPPEQQTLIGPKRKRQQKKEPHLGVRKGLKNKWVMARRLTSAPDDLLGVHRDVRYAADLLGTQMVNYDTNIRRKRQRFKEQGLAADEEERLTMGIVVIRAILGGLEMNIDWVMLGSVFKDYSLNFLKKWWQVVWNKKKPMVEKLTKDFQQIFIVGYRKGQVQPIDYDHVIDYDFNTLIDWAMSKINTPTQEEKTFDLPNSFSELKNKYALVPEPRSNYWSEQYYYTLAAVYQRMNLVNSVPFTYPLQQETSSYEINDYALAKSWCRAAAVTPDHLWDSKAANKLLNRLPSAIIIKAREDLLKNKIITKNKRLRTNGRVYNLPDAFNAVFVRTGKIIYEKQYREAYDFKCELDQKFRNGETSVNIPWGVNEGAVLAITNLQADGCIHVQKSNIRANKFGLTEGGYETRLIDKAKYRFQMDITPTSSYVYNHTIPNLDAISEPPPVGPRGALPVWRSIKGEVIEGMWRKVLLGVTGAFVLRSSIDIEGLEKVFAPSLDAWEIKQLIDWGVERGVWQRCDYESLGATAREANNMQGWEVGDWWWMIVGRYLVESDRIIWSFEDGPGGKQAQ
ncbi:hypothetical protein SBOR_4755 [Sclerotinia borealis F-4128]|uniref:C2H2-type domain-containing protein n=1 Tax=Sclerotinia borealis (strain F-4128) TaxID=1432307 RepID=W9CJQ3_SCLBF|nr:hypothetical protein SBOR_4755 [Sclerotinia borealis F-4128]